MDSGRLICGDNMEEGFIVDHTYGGQVAGSWIKGPPELGLFGGVKAYFKTRRTIQLSVAWVADS